jgi:hypothetical protein
VHREPSCRPKGEHKTNFAIPRSVMTRRALLFIAASWLLSLHGLAHAKDASSRSVRGAGGGGGQQPSGSNERVLQFSGSVTGLDLINADTEQTITTLSNNQVIVVSDISGMTTPSFNIEATFTGSGIDSVLFKYGGSNYRTDKGAPYAFCSNSGRAFSTCLPLGIGTHTVSATPYSSVAAGSVAGPEVSVTFTIVAGGGPAPAKAPVVAPTAVPTFVPPSPVAAQPTGGPQCATPKVSFLLLQSIGVPAFIDRKLTL